MTHTLTAKEKSLAKIFSDDYVFSIPGYQRPYSWGAEQAEELLGDLLAALSEAPNQLSDAPPYFLGSIVLIKAEALPEATVVDGQQRLTTLTLLLSAIRTAVSDSAVQTGITKRIYEHGDVVSATQARYRLSLRERDRDFFRQYVQHEDGLPKLLELSNSLPDAQSRLQANAKLFATVLAKLNQSELVRLVQFIITRCYIVTVATPDLDSAYRIFGVLNSRGLDLSATDILKAEIVGGIDVKLRDDYTKKWEDCEEDLGREAFGELFSHIRNIYRKAKPQGTLLKEFRHHVTALSDPTSFVDDLLMPMADAFEQISDASYASQRNAEQVNEHLRWLNRLEFTDWMPPALAFFIRHRNDPGAVLDFFRDLERLGYAMLACKFGVNDRIDRFSKLTAAVERGDDLLSEPSPLQLSPAEQYATYSALNGPLYSTHSSRALAVLLLRLDALMSDASATYHHDVISVEHVLPQQPAPRSEWTSWIPDSAAHLIWVHRLGNLTLLSRKKNSAASNYEFAKKKQAYFSKGGVSTFALTTQVLEHEQWTVEVMEQRQESMLKTFEMHWRLADRKSEAQLTDAVLATLVQGEYEPVFELTSARHGLRAMAREAGTEFIVLAGSMAKQNWTGRNDSYEHLRIGLIADGILKPSDQGPWLVFDKDAVFASPSAASATVLGRPDNGRTSWRLKGTSITYAAWQQSLPPERPTTGRRET